MENKNIFLEAYTAHADALFRHCLYKVSDRERAKDLLQDAFTKTWAYMAEGKRIDNMKAFLYRTVNNLIVDEYRRKKMSSLDDMAEAGFEPVSTDEDRPLDRLDGERAIRLIRQLPEPYAEAVFMKYVQDLSLQEMSDITGEAENTMAVRVHRGLQKLREIVGDNES